MGKGLGIRELKKALRIATFSIVTVLSLGVWTEVVFISYHAQRLYFRRESRLDWGSAGASAKFYDVGDFGVGGVCFGGIGGVVEAFRDGGEGRKRTSPGACVGHRGEDGRSEIVKAPARWGLDDRFAVGDGDFGFE